MNGTTKDEASDVAAQRIQSEGAAEAAEKVVTAVRACLSAAEDGALPSAAHAALAREHLTRNEVSAALARFKALAPLAKDLQSSCSQLTAKLGGDQVAASFLALAARAQEVPRPKGAPEAIPFSRKFELTRIFAMVGVGPAGVVTAGACLFQKWEMLGLVAFFAAIAAAAIGFHRRGVARARLKLFARKEGLIVVDDVGGRSVCLPAEVIRLATKSETENLNWISPYALRVHLPGLGDYLFRAWNPEALLMASAPPQPAPLEPLRGGVAKVINAAGEVVAEKNSSEREPPPVPPTNKG